MQKIKGKSVFCLVATCLICLLLIVSPQSTFAQVDAQQPLKIAYRIDSAPLQYQDESGQASGVLIDFWRIWAEKSQQSIQFIGGNNSETQRWLNEGKVDAIAGLFSSARRETQMAFSKPLLHSAYSLYYNPNLTQLDTNLDINQRSIGVTQGSYHHQWLLEHYPKADIHSYSGYNQLFEAAITGEIELFITQAIYLKKYLSDHPVSVRFEAFTSVLYDRAYRAAVKRDNQQLLAKINRHLADISNQDKNAISAKWSGFHWEYLPPKLNAINNAKVQLNLTPTEQDWLAKHPEITIGVDGNWPPVDFTNQQGIHSGVLSEYLELIENRLGISLKVKSNARFKDMVQQLRKGEIKLGTTIVQTADREQDLWFTLPYFSAVKVIVSNSEGKQYSDLAQLSGKTLAIEDGFFLIDVLRKSHPEINLKTYPSTADALKALSFQQVDAYVGNQAVISWLKQNLQLSNISFSGDPQLPFALQRFAVHQDPQWQPLVGILNKALASISVAERQAILSHWVNNRQQFINALPLNLSNQQNIWLEQHQQWNIGVDPKFAPLSFVDEKGSFGGISSEVLNIVTNIIGVSYKLSETSSWSNTLQALQQAEVDIVPSVPYVEQNQQETAEMLFSKPYLTRPYMIFVQDNTQFVSSVEDLVGHRVGVLNHHNLENQLQVDYPLLEQFPFSSPQQALLSLSAGEIDAYIGILDSTSLSLTELGIADIKIAAPSPYSYQASIGVRKDWPELMPILNQAIDRISAQQMKQIKNHWFSVDFEHQANNYLIWRAILITCMIALPIIIVIFIWNRKLAIAKDKLKLSSEKLAQAKQSAEQANNFKSQFLANMSHEIRTPMNAIVGFTHLMLSSKLDDTQQDYANKIKRASLTLLGVINDILDVSKVEAGKLEIEQIKFHLSEIVYNLSNLLAPKAIEKNIDIFMDVDPKVPDILIGDPLRLEQILINLTQNAIKFTEQGQVVVKIKLLESVPNRVTLEFSVNDTGIGISEDNLSKLFQPFAQADDSLTRTHGGTGLGLSISKLLVELMGGEIRATSIENQGSTFSFQLNLAYSEDKQYDQQLQAELRDMRVLVVDDNQLARDISSEILHSFSFRVDCASNAATAIDMLDRHNNIEPEDPYRLVLMDWKMPRMNGIEASKYIKEMPLRMMPAIILVTAYGREDVSRQVEKEQLDAFLIKPLNASLLFDCIMKLFHQQPSSSLATQAMVPHLLEGKVLLVEDHPINQELAKEMLTQMGLQASIAKHGQQAIDMLQAEPFDLVLMDIQMPVLDGFEATRAIRKNSRFATLPIIAMTAHAMKEDQQRCFEAGMNAHLAKPIDPEQLFSVLSQYLAPQAQPDTEPALVINAPAEDPLPVIDGLDSQWGITRVGGNAQLYQKLLSDFYSRHHQELETLSQACRLQQFDDVKRIIHTIRGVAGNLGAKSLEQAATDFEPLIAQAEQAFASQQWQEFQHQFKHLFEQLASSLAPPSSAPEIVSQSPTTVLNTSAEALLTPLRELLEEGNPQAKKTITEFENKLPRILYDELVRLINEFEFDNALTVLDEHINKKG
ncbi:transporter substrate-binding domain-containing protein [Agarivorans sp. Z349TD_8]|uniref:transporter substrate-binding domain-containing protein n=1 Tax=Agarivorans sp. Z349TD_8 TaxID=3421434 RepID=UPI003D7D320C